MAHETSGGDRRNRPTEFVGGSAESKPRDQAWLLEPARREACLVITEGPRREAEFALRGERVTIGRDEAVEVTIDEPSASRAEKRRCA